MVPALGPFTVAIPAVGTKAMMSIMTAMMFPLRMVTPAAGMMIAMLGMMVAVLGLMTPLLGMVIPVFGMLAVMLAVAMVGIAVPIATVPTRLIVLAIPMLTPATAGATIVVRVVIGQKGHDAHPGLDGPLECVHRRLGGRGGPPAPRPAGRCHQTATDDHRGLDPTHGNPPPGKNGCILNAPMNAPPGGKFRDPAVVDFGVDGSGTGRRLERLGGVLVDRPLPQAASPPKNPALWASALARYDRDGRGGPAGGRWEFRGDPPDPWQVTVPLPSGSLVLEVRPAPSGQLGVFLEQIEQWQWLARTTPRGAVMLSLFGHSGAATLALASAGAEVVHVDASRQAIALARRNAAASGLADLPIRWVCEDVATFVGRQLRRGGRFSGAVLDPPSWGHGPKGQAFAIDRDLVPLVEETVRLLGAEPGRPAGPLLLTSHSPGWNHPRLRDTLLSASRAAGLDCQGLDSGVLSCTDDIGRLLPLGDFARWTRAS